jgi:hypothetical protein
MRVSSTRITCVLMLATVLLMGCGSHTAATRAPAGFPTTVVEVGPGAAERLAAVQRLIGTRAPTPIRAGRLTQIQLGDGQFGPSDFIVYALLQVDIADIAAWEKAAAPQITGGAVCAVSPTAPAWWLSAADCAAARSYDTNWFSANPGEMHVLGDGRIFVRTMTQ